MKPKSKLVELFSVQELSLPAPQLILGFRILKICAFLHPRRRKMYADRLESESGSRNTVKDRINGGSGDNSTRSRQVTGKRFEFTRSV